MDFAADGVKYGNLEVSLTVGRGVAEDFAVIYSPVYGLPPSARPDITELLHVWRYFGPTDCSPIQMLETVAMINATLPKVPPNYDYLADSSFLVAPTLPPASIRDIEPPTPRFTNYKGRYEDEFFYSITSPTVNGPPGPPNVDGHIIIVPLVGLTVSDGPAGARYRWFNQRYLISFLGSSSEGNQTMWRFKRSRIADAWGEPSDTALQNLGFFLYDLGSSLFDTATLDGITWEGDFVHEISYLYGELNTPACSAGGSSVSFPVGFEPGPFPDQTGPLPNLIKPYTDSPLALCNYTLPITEFLK